MSSPGKCHRGHYRRRHAVPCQVETERLAHRRVQQGRLSAHDLLSPQETSMLCGSGVCSADQLNEGGTGERRIPADGCGLAHRDSSGVCGAVSARSARRPTGRPGPPDGPGRRRRPGRSAVTSPAIEARAASRRSGGQGARSSAPAHAIHQHPRSHLMTLRSHPTRVVCIALQ